MKLGIWNSQQCISEKKFPRSVTAPWQTSNAELCQSVKCFDKTRPSDGMIKLAIVQTSQDFLNNSVNLRWQRQIFPHKTIRERYVAFSVPTLRSHHVSLSCSSLQSSPLPQRSISQNPHHRALGIYRTVIDLTEKEMPVGGFPKCSFKSTGIRKILSTFKKLLIWDNVPLRN